MTQTVADQWWSLAELEGALAEAQLKADILNEAYEEAYKAYATAYEDLTRLNKAVNSLKALKA